MCGSELAKLRGKAFGGELPAIDPGAIRLTHDAVRAAVRAGRLTSAHDIAEGGLAVALAECCVAGGLGARVSVPEGLELFGEAPGCGFVVSGPPEALEGFTVIGEVAGDTLEVAGRLKVAVSDLWTAHRSGLEQDSL
jgi:phosphoribosylformylglycinamidine synthase